MDPIPRSIRPVLIRFRNRTFMKTNLIFAAALLAGLSVAKAQLSYSFDQFDYGTNPDQPSAGGPLVRTDTVQSQVFDIGGGVTMTMAWAWPNSDSGQPPARYDIVVDERFIDPGPDGIAGDGSNTDPNSADDVGLTLRLQNGASSTGSTATGDSNNGIYTFTFSEPVFLNGWDAGGLDYGGPSAAEHTKINFFADAAQTVLVAADTIENLSWDNINSVVDNSQGALIDDTITDGDGYHLLATRSGGQFESLFQFGITTTPIRVVTMEVYATNNAPINYRNVGDTPAADGLVIDLTANPGASDPDNAALDASTDIFTSGRSFHFGLVNFTPLCELDIVSASATNVAIDAAGAITYDLDVEVSATNPPAGDITVSAGGQTATIAAGATTTTVTGISLDEDGPFSVTTTFDSDPACSDTDIYDAAVIQRCSTDNVGGTVFLDTNNNGTDDTEAGVPFVPVRAYDETNALVGFGVTNSVGDFTLTLLDGTTLLDMTDFLDGVRVEFGVDQDLPVRPGTAGGGGLIQVLPDPVGNCDLDLAISDPGATTKEIGNVVFIDKDFDGVQDGCDVPLPNADVALYTAAGDLVATAQTDANGFYLFSSDTTGVDTPSSIFGLSELLPDVAGGADKEFCVVIGNQGATPQFVDGILTVDGVRYELATANVADTGIGSVAEEADSDGLEGDVAGLTGVLNACTTIPAGAGGCNIQDVDFGVVIQLPRVGNLVFIDVNGDGNYDAGIDTPVSGINVQLFLAGTDPIANPNAFVDESITRSDTGNVGCFELRASLAAFTLGETDYFVYIPPSQFVGTALEGTLSVPGNGGDDQADDNIGENGIDSSSPATTGISSNTITLIPGGEPINEAGVVCSTFEEDNNLDSTVDFGFTPAAATFGFGNLVFMDVNGDGNFDPGIDMGVAGVLVQIFREAGATDVSVGFDNTDDDGFWRIDGLPAGTYYALVRGDNFGSSFAPLFGKLSSPGAGGDNGIDDTAANGDENGIDDADPATNGIRSSDIVLGPLEPVGETGATGPVSPSDEPDNRFDSTVDFGFITPVGVGNLVFCDENGDGNYDPAEGETGINGVTVEIYSAGDIPGTDDPAGSDITTGGGFWEVNGLVPGDYFAFIPGDEFTTTGALVGKNSSPGNGADTTTDDNGDENGLDTPGPNGGISSSDFTLTLGDSAGEPGASGPAGTNTPDENVNTTIDFGFAPGKATNFAAFAASNGLTGADATPAADPDMDGRSNLEEFALCLIPGSGLNGAAVDGGDSTYPGFCIESDGSIIDGTFLRPLGVSGLTYNLEFTDTLADPTVFASVTIDGGNSTFVDQGDGTELVTITDVEAATALTSGAGFVRLSITLDSPAETATTKPQGWLTHTVTPNCESFAFPFEDKSIYTGKGTLSGDTLTLDPTTLAAGDDFAAALAATGARYYIEVTEGDNIGHRVEIVPGSTANTIMLAVDGDPCGGPVDGTLATLPADLSGDLITVRRYRTIDELFPPADYTAGGDSDTGANLLFFDPNDQAFITFFLLDDGTNPPKWVQVGSTADRGADIVPPGRGVFTHNKAPAASFDLLEIGTVRCNPSVQPLKAGFTFVAATHPVATSPADRAMVATTFTGTTDPDTADQLLFWKGDADPGATGYDARFYLVHDDGTNPALDQWTDTDDVNILDRNELDDFGADRSAIYDAENANLTYLVPVPFTTN